LKRASTDSRPVNAGTQANLDRLAAVTATIAQSVVAHDDRIEKLVTNAEIQQQEWAQLRREFQAYPFERLIAACAFPGAPASPVHSDYPPKFQ
jgi:hypothetical protein